MDYKQIVWLASYPKSGNTWVRAFLDAYFLQDVDINEIVCSVSDTISHRHAVGDGSDPREYPVDIQQMTRPMALLRLVRGWEANRERTGASVPLFVKTHSAHVVANGIELLPHSLTKAIIHIVRDPRDAFLSFEKHMGLPRDKALKAFTDKYRVLFDENRAAVGDFISSWADNTRSYLINETHNVLHVRYEDMRSNPVEAFTQILEHAGVAPDRDRVAAAVDLASLDRLRASEEKGGFKEASPHSKFFGKGEVGGWKGKLSLLDERRIIKDCASVMKRFGYLNKAKGVA